MNCRYCGAADQRSTFCTNCGAPIGTPQGSAPMAPAAGPPRSGGRRWVWVAAAAAVLVVAGGTFAILATRSDDAAAPPSGRSTSERATVAQDQSRRGASRVIETQDPEEEEAELPPVVVTVTEMQAEQAGDDAPVVTSTVGRQPPATTTRQDAAVAGSTQVRSAPSRQTLAPNPTPPPPDGSLPVITSFTSPPGGQAAYSAGADYYTFATPSGNIVCGVAATGARCQVKEFAFVPESAPAGQSCTGAVWGSVFDIGAEGPSYGCKSVDGLGGQVLEYGYELTAGSFSCRSAHQGVTCLDNSTGRGFTLNRNSPSLQY